MSNEVEVTPEILAMAQKLNTKQDAKLAKTREGLSKYPHAKADTLEYNAEAKKYSVEIECTKCGKPRRVFTSDLFQITTCVDCAGEAKKEKQAAKKELIKAAMAKIAADKASE